MKHECSDKDFAALGTWYAEIASKERAHVGEERDGFPDHYLITDACKNGWSAMRISLYDGEVTFVAGKWSNQGDSNISEPWCVWHGVKHLFPREGAAEKVLLLTDNANVKFGIPRGYAASWHVNKVIHLLHSHYPRLKFDAIHVAGSINCMDEPSRGEPIDQAKLMECLDIMSKHGLRRDWVDRVRGRSVRLPYRLGMSSFGNLITLGST